MSTPTPAGERLEPTAESSPSQVRKVVISSYLGSTIEFYDFLLYATAASLVFGPVFFGNLDPWAATIASLGTFAAGYVARPIGGLILGHFGDRIGRKRLLLLSMMVMGLASFAIGLIPPPSMIGSWAAVILVTMRVLQGIAIGGEWGGAVLMALEHTGGRNRGLAAAFTNAGAPTGAVLGTLAMTAASTLPDDQFLSWGWRIPFLASALLLLLGLFVRLQVTESPLFAKAVQAGQLAEQPVPLFQVLRRPMTVIKVALACMAAFGIQTMFATFAVGYAVGTGLSRPQALTAFAISQALAVPAVLASGALSDRLGRRPVMIGSLAVFLVLCYPILNLLGSGSFGQVALAFFLGIVVCQSTMYGPMAAFIAEQFGTGSRYTGASLGYQLATLIGAGFTPVIVASLAAVGRGSTIWVGVFLIGLALVSALFVALIPESRKHDLETV
ncbi:MFS transporter [Enemella evansiae]|uniref:MFS transporter n=1 Tax=Enemella evansiae TaxID=2016499 RepID=A0A255GNH5_9ACTN|nr:MFS transporter [Enemella evansiae]OYO17370.1 MFS transporter [Enemella evansiae]